MTIRLSSGAALACAGLLSACVSVPPPEVVVVPDATLPGDACNSAAYQQYVGERSPAITLPAGTTVRHFRTGDPLTMDNDPQRINFEYDRAGTLVRVTCG